MVGYGRHSHRTTSRASWRTSGESPNFPYFMATMIGEIGSDTATQRSVYSNICHCTHTHHSQQNKTSFLLCT